MDPLLYIASLPEGLDPDDLIHTNPEHWRQLTQAPPGSIVLAFDSDWPGQQAAMRAIDLWRNTEYADGQAYSYNGTWVIMADAYEQFQNELLDLGIGMHTPKPDPSGEEHFWVDPSEADLRSWPVPRLGAALNGWHQVVEKALGFGNAYMLKFVLPHADERIAQIRKELLRRATPKLTALGSAKTIKGYWDVKEVRAKIDPFDIYGLLIADLEESGSWWRAACPLHNHKTAPAQGKKGSLAISKRSAYFECHNCHAKGTVFDFVAQLERLPFAEAVNRVAQLGAL